MTARPILGVVALAACSQRPPPTPGATTRDATPEELVRARCAVDGSEVLTTWSGGVYAFVPDEAPAHLFDVVGMNVARCVRADDGWHLTSRELLYYLDPATGEVLRRWRNPWSGDEVTVMHVANRLVQGGPFGPTPTRISGDTAALALDLPLFYPNPLASDPALRAYAPAPAYQAGEFFTLRVPADELAGDHATVSSMTFTWHRIGPWLPWMKQGDHPGVLVYSARGEKVASVAALPPLLADELADRVPLFRHAPRCLLAARNETSWSYFAAHVAEYLAGDRFPLPAPDAPEPCP